MTDTVSNAVGPNKGSEIVAALEAAYSEIRDIHPELPDVMFYTGSGRKGRGMRLGHFWRDRWLDALSENRLPEIFIGGECLGLGTDEVVCTLLHECAHAMAFIRDVQDVSPTNHNYHNKRFREIAEELTLKCTMTMSRGFSATDLTDETHTKYEKVFTALESATSLYLDGTGGTTTKKPTKDKNLMVAVCECTPPRKFRASKKVIEGDPITCGGCMADFYYEQTM